MDQFQDFEKYMNGVNPFGMKSGIVLIDPPEEWYVDPLYNLLRVSTHSDPSVRIGKPPARHWTKWSGPSKYEILSPKNSITTNTASTRNETWKRCAVTTYPSGKRSANKVSISHQPGEVREGTRPALNLDPK